MTAAPAIERAECEDVRLEDGMVLIDYGGETWPLPRGLCRALTSDRRLIDCVKRVMLPSITRRQPKE